MRLPGFEPGSRNWQSRILTKLYYNRSTDLQNMSLLKGTVWNTDFNIIMLTVDYGSTTKRKTR